ncbi:hypothetical protein BAE44_0016233 [Dichanthelium oligosanthes]|uniref:Uncharacterized protein n=1 Tax=Dichanthelium oligosanthes TaxID=888268 RepID=A0A1E5VC84_9POAL|nr:hypothetical protein BAE44_0016233 [Dichanthelium oligosanthes]
MHREGKFHIICLAATCWALWRARNSISFEKKICEISFGDHGLILYYFWEALQNEGDKEILEAGAEALKSAALSLHPHEAPPEDTGIVLL